MAFMLFKTEVVDGKNKSTVFAGQISNNSLGAVVGATKKCTGQKATGVVSNEVGKAAVTDEYLVDVIDKKLFGSKFPWDEDRSAIPQ